MLSKLIQRTIEVYFTFEIPSKTVKASNFEKSNSSEIMFKEVFKSYRKKTGSLANDLTNIRTISPTAKRGSAWEVKLRYPEKLHPSHSDFPFSPERRIAKCEELSRYQNKLIEKLSKVETEN
ncbi:2393_t:CDS:2 [Rhizophagus irregularis]|nr:2393_t:CDS:2 [Rhizophagus irregularis]